MNRVLSIIGCAFLAASASAAQGSARTTASEIVREVGFDQKLGDSVPLDVELVDEHGAKVKLGDYFGSKPVVLLFVYYKCPMLCTQVLNGFVHAARVVTLDPGDDFEIVTVSIHPREDPALATEKKARYVAEYARPSAERGWHFLTGNEDSIRRLTQSAGFRYVYLSDIDEYAHASGFVVLTPEARIARYFYGVEFSSRDLRLALVEASSGRIGSLVDQVLLLCYHYDPTTGKYGLVIMNLIRFLGILTVAVLGAFMWTMLRRERLTARLESGG